MTYETTGLETGTERGFIWVRVVGQNGNPFYFTFPPGSEIPSNVTFDHNHYSTTRGPFPFSGKEFPESACIRAEFLFSEFDWETWLDEQVSRPSSCAIEIHVNRYSKDIHLYATTFRRGRVETVTRKIDGTRDILPQIKDAYGYFERNCPAPTSNQEKRIAISAVGIGLMSAMKKQGVDLIRSRHEDNENKDLSEKRYGYRSISVDGILINAEGIRKVTFERHTDHRQILVEVQLDAGHRYKEDEKGATTEIFGEYGEVLVSGARGRSLLSYVGLPGAETQRIRTSKMEWDEDSGRKFGHRMRLRSSVENVAFIIPEGKEDTDEEVMRDLKSLIGPDAHFVTAEATIMRHLEGFDPRTLRQVLSLLKASGEVNLSEHGGEAINLKSPGGHISVGYATHNPLPSPESIYGEAA